MSDETSVIAPDNGNPSSGQDAKTSPKGIAPVPYARFKEKAAEAARAKEENEKLQEMASESQKLRKEMEQINQSLEEEAAEELENVASRLGIGDSAELREVLTNDENVSLYTKARRLKKLLSRSGSRITGGVPLARQSVDPRLSLGRKVAEGRASALEKREYLRSLRSTNKSENR